MLKLASISDVEHVPLYMLGHNQCKFPVEENRKVAGHFLFCAAPTRPGERYCPHHSQLSAPKDSQLRKGK